MTTVFVTGATGVLGRGTVGRLLEGGHQVRALARNAERAASIVALGAEPVVGDICDVDAMTRAVGGAELVLHLATRIPPIAKARRASAWAENTKLRAVGTKVLVDAALASGVERVVAESITYIYSDGGADWIDERSPVDATAALASVVTLEAEVARFAATRDGHNVGIALRFGGFYGPDARSTDEFIGGAARRIAPVIGAPDGYVSSIHTSDAASAVVASLAAPTGVYNIVDDVPLTRREYADAFAQAFGLRRLRILAPVVVRASGGPVAQALLRSQRVSNNAMKRATNWGPATPSVVEGWAGIAATRKEISHA